MVRFFFLLYAFIFLVPQSEIHRIGIEKSSPPRTTILLNVRLICSCLLFYLSIINLCFLRL